jgi:multiple sugar transport system substrate-binding protein
MKKIILLIIALLLNCGQQSQQTVEFWQFWTDPKAKPVIDSIVDQFEQENPGWKVNVTDLTWSDGHQKILVAFGAGTPPDLLELGSDWIAEFAAGHALSEIAIDTVQFLLTEPGLFENKIYAQPWFLASRIFFFNKSLLDKANLSLPDDWAGMLEICRKLDSPADDIAGFGANLAEPHRLYKKFLPFVWSCGGSIISDNKINIDNPQVLKALEFYGQLTQCGQVEIQRHLEDAFVDGRIGFLMSGGWFLKRLIDNPPAFDYELAPMLPEHKGQPAYSFAGGEYLVIPSKSKNKEAANRLLEVIMRPRNVAALCDSVGFGFPPYKRRVRENLPVDVELMFEQLQNSHSTPVHPRWIYVEQIIENMVEQVTLGKLTPDQAIAEAQAKIDETLKY